MSFNNVLHFKTGATFGGNYCDFGAFSDTFYLVHPENMECLENKSPKPDRSRA